MNIVYWSFCNFQRQRRQCSGQYFRRKW